MVVATRAANHVLYPHRLYVPRRARDKRKKAAGGGGG